MRRPPVSSTNLVVPPTVVIPDQREAYSLPNVSLRGKGLVFGRVTHNGDPRPTGGALLPNFSLGGKVLFLVVSPTMATSDQREAYSHPNFSLGGKGFCFLVVPPTRVTPDQREASKLSSFPFLLTTAIALLPFALLVELMAPVPVGVLDLQCGCCYLRIELRRAHLACRRSAATAQSPELGDCFYTRSSFSYAAAVR